VKLLFDCRDIFRAPRLALSLQRMWIQLVGLFIGYLGYLVFTYGAMIAAGFQFSSSWAKYGLLPCLFMVGEPFPWFSWIIFAVGVMLLLIVFLITNTAVARAAYMLIKGNNFYTWREAFAFSMRKAASIILTPISLGILIGLLILGALIIGLLGKIPVVGVLGIGAFTLLWLLAALFLVFIIVILFVSIVLVPSIIATTDEDAFEAVFQTFSITWNQPWRLVIYEVAVVILAIFSTGILAVAIKKAVWLMNALLSTFMGSDYINLANNAQAMVQGWLLSAQIFVQGIYQHFSHYVYFSHEFIAIPANELTTVTVIASYLCAFTLLFIAGWVVSYGLSIFTIGNTLIYIVLRHKKDGENLLERQDAEEEELEEDEQTEEQESVDSE
jgi:hypothetical protein